MSSEKIRGIELGKEELWPSMRKYFEDDQKFRVILMLPGDLFTKFKAAVEAEFGAFGPYESRRALEDAIKQWINARVR